jgi:hypothetical protein
MGAAPITIDALADTELPSDGFWTHPTHNESARTTHAVSTTAEFVAIDDGFTTVRSARRVSPLEFYRGYRQVERLAVDQTCN